MLIHPALVRRRLSSGSRPVARGGLITLATIQERTQGGVTTFLRLGPRATEPRRVVAYMLIVSASKLCDPVLNIVKMEPDDGLFHLRAPPNA